MKPIQVNREMFLLPERCSDIKIAEHQNEYLTLPATVTPDGKIITQWELDSNDLALLNNGVPLTLVILTGIRPPQPLTMNPIMLAVGGLDLRK